MYLKKHLKNGILTLSRRRMNNKIKSEIDSDCDDLNSIDGEYVISKESTDTKFLDDDLNSSSLHISSLHKSSSTHTARTIRSDYDSFNSSIGAGSNSSIRFRSSLSSKGTKKASLKRKQNVSFNDSTIQWTMVESYKGYSSDLWWSREEVKQRQVAMSNVLFEYSQDELFKIGQYTNAYHNARHKSVISKHNNNNDNHHHSIDVVASKSKINLSNDDYQTIVRGKANGWDGLEKIVLLSPSQLLSSSSTNNVMTRQMIVTKIVNAQYNNMDNQDKANTIRSLSKSFTMTDRSWAVVMGKADRDALSR